MLKIYTILLLIFSSYLIFAQQRDTIKVRTIEYQQERIGWFDFPPNDESFEKVYMNYTLKCPPAMPCGEWDYLTFVELREYFLPNYSINGNTPDSSRYMNDTTYNYSPIIENGEMIGLDSTAKEPLELVYFDTESDNNEPIEILEVWPLAYQYEFDNQGNKIDSSLIEGWETVYLTSQKRVFLDNEYTIFESYEIMRYITPYGNGLDLGDGFTWKIDMTDFLPLLHGKVFLYAPHGKNWDNPTSQNVYSDLELTFDFIKGTPQREIKRVEKMWTSRPQYNSNFEDYFQPMNYQLLDGEFGAVLKVIQSGHGFGASEDNCAEFCNKEANVKVDGQQIYTRDIWRECGDNPLYPQGGTWLSDRSNWCPGEDVPYHDYDLSEILVDGEIHSVDYSMEDYEFVRNSDGTAPNYKVATFMITYGDYNFETDAAIREILAPSNADQFLRINPSAGSPKIMIENNGQNQITSVKFKYGIKGLVEQEYLWEANLEKLEQVIIDLPYLELEKAWEGVGEFFVEITEVNGAADEYSDNNYGFSFVESPPTFYNQLEIEIKTNNYNDLNASSPYTFLLQLADGTVLERANSTQNNQTYSLELTPQEGCHIFELENLFGYGLGYWVLAQQAGLKAGSLKLIERDGDNEVRFNPDFGNKIHYQFFFQLSPTIADDKKSNLNFAQTGIEEQKEIAVKVFPENQEELIISDIQLEKRQNNEETYFEIIGSSMDYSNGLTLTTNDTLELKIGFSPQSTGLHNDRIIISSNDKVNPEYFISLRGIGTNVNSIKEIHSINDLANINYTNNTLNIELNDLYHTLSSNSTLRIFDLTGRTLFTSDIRERFYEEQLNLNSGMYFISLQSGTYLQTEKILISK